MYEGALAEGGYRQSVQSVSTPRSAEYQIFARVTGKLAAAKDTSAPFAKIAEAIHDNLRLWTAIALDVASEDNKLPAELRSKLFYLSEFTRAHSAKALAGDAPLDALIDVNTCVMRGLRGNAAQQEAGQ